MSRQSVAAHGAVPWARSPSSVIEPCSLRRAIARHCIGDRSCASSTTTCPKLVTRSISPAASSISTRSAALHRAAFTVRGGFAQRRRRLLVVGEQPVAPPAGRSAGPTTSDSGGDRRPGARRGTSVTGCDRAHPAQPGLARRVAASRSPTAAAAGRPPGPGPAPGRPRTAGPSRRTSSTMRRSGSASIRHRYDPSDTMIGSVGLDDAAPSSALRQHRRHPRVVLDQRRGLAVGAPHRHPGDQVVHRGLLHLELAERRQHARRCSDRNARVRPDDQHARAPQPLAVQVEQVRRPVQADRGLAGARRALHADRVGPGRRGPARPARAGWWRRCRASARRAAARSRRSGCGWRCRAPRRGRGARPRSWSGRP